MLDYNIFSLDIIQIITLHKSFTFSSEFLRFVTISFGFGYRFNIHIQFPKIFTSRIPSDVTEFAAP